MPSISVNLSEGQKVKINRAMKKMRPVIIRLKNEDLSGKDSLVISDSDSKKYQKALLKSTGVSLLLTFQEGGSPYSTGGNCGEGPYTVGKGGEGPFSIGRNKPGKYLVAMPKSKMQMGSLGPIGSVLAVEAGKEAIKQAPTIAKEGRKAIKKIFGFGKNKFNLSNLTSDEQDEVKMLGNRLDLLLSKKI